MSVKIDHVGIAVRALERWLPFWSESLGLEVEACTTVESEKVKVALLLAGSSRIELLEPTDPSSPVARFIDKRGEGMHHLTLAVGDLDGTLERLGQRGVEVLGGGPRPGAGGRQVAFLHPRAAGGVLVELVAAPAAAGHQAAEIGCGSVVLAYLHGPQEKIWGLVRRLDPTGVVLEGVDLSSFDDWMAQIELGEESVVGPSVLFVPMARVEKILLDRPSGDLPSLAQRFERRVGRTVHDVMG